MKRPSSLTSSEEQKKMNSLEAVVFVMVSIVLALFLLGLSKELQTYGLGFATLRVEPNILLSILCYVAAMASLVNPLQYLYFRKKAVAWGIFVVGVGLIPIVGISRIFSL